MMRISISCLQSLYGLGSITTGPGTDSEGDLKATLDYSQADQGDLQVSDFR